MNDFITNALWPIMLSEWLLVLQCYIFLIHSYPSSCILHNVTVFLQSVNLQSQTKEVVRESHVEYVSISYSPESSLWISFWSSRHKNKIPHCCITKDLASNKTLSGYWNEIDHDHYPVRGDLILDSASFLTAMWVGIQITFLVFHS